MALIRLTVKSTDTAFDNGFHVYLMSGLKKYAKKILTCGKQTLKQADCLLERA